MIQGNMFRSASHIVYWFIASLVLSATAAGCGGAPGQDAFADCRYGAPEPIFHAQLPAVARHDFRLSKGQGLEYIAFTDGLELEVLQTGCDHIQQEFRFRQSGQFRQAPADFWIDETARIFSRLGQLGPEYLSYFSLAQAIDEQANRIRLAQNTELQPGFFLNISPQSAEQSTTLVVTIGEQR
jgi:hypothetical protein